MAQLEDFFSKTFIDRKIGTFVLDVTVEESHQSELKITKNPIESGGVVADHAYLLPRSLTIRGVVVDYEVEQAAELLSQLTSVNGIEGVLSSVVLGDFNPLDKSTQDKLLDSAITVLGDNVLNRVRNIAPWLPGAIGQALDFGEAPSRVRKMYEELNSLQRSGEMLTITTKAKIYENMVLTGIAAVTNNDNALELVLSFDEIQVTAEQLVIEGGLTGGEADMKVKEGKGKGKDGKDDGDTGADGDASPSTKRSDKIKHQSVTERMRAQVEAEKAKLKGRLGF